jgi:uncharacterized lipoprotein YmbA
MWTRLSWIAAAAATTAGLGGCVSLKRTPEARFFVLRSLVEPPAAPALPSPGGLVGLLPVRVPGHLERAQLVTWKGPGEVRIDEYQRWAEPLDVGVARTLAENLDALLPDHPVIRSPWPAAVTPRCRVRVDVRLFGLQESGEVRLEGRWTILPGRGERPSLQRPASLRRGPLPTGPAGVDGAAAVEAMSELLADLAKEIADAVRELPPEAGEK